MNRDNGNNLSNNNLSDDMVSSRKMGESYVNPVLFPADRLIAKMGDNMARAEADIDETPLWTENTPRIVDEDDK